MFVDQLVKVWVGDFEVVVGVVEQCYEVGCLFEELVQLVVFGCYVLVGQYLFCCFGVYYQYVVDVFGIVFVVDGVVVVGLVYVFVLVVVCDGYYVVDVLGCVVVIVYLLDLWVDDGLDFFLYFVCWQVQ